MTNAEAVEEAEAVDVAIRCSIATRILIIITLIDRMAVATRRINCHHIRRISHALTNPSKDTVVTIRVLEPHLTIVGQPTLLAVVSPVEAVHPQAHNTFPTAPMEEAVMDRATEGLVEIMVAMGATVATVVDHQQDGTITEPTGDMGDMEPMATGEADTHTTIRGVEAGVDIDTDNPWQGC